MNNKRFGILSSIASGIIITVVTFLFKINLIAINSIGKIPIYLWLILLSVFFLLISQIKKIGRRTINAIYLGVVVCSFIYLNSMFQWSVECCPNEYESMSDWNATKSLVWMVHLPFSFVIIIILGVIFDFLRAWRLRV